MSAGPPETRSLAAFLSSDIKEGHRNMSNNKFLFVLILLFITIISGCGTSNQSLSTPSSSSGSGSTGGTSGTDGTTTGTAILTWNAPTTRSDGSTLNPATDLSTYKIYYGTSSRNYTQVVNVPNPGTTIITRSVNLSSGIYYFAVTVVDTMGQESGYSVEVSKTI